MKRGLLLLLLLVIPIVFAETTIINKELNPEDSVIVDGVNYSFYYSFKSEKASFTSPFNKLILSKNDCVVRGYHRFCFVNVTEKVEQYDMKMRINVSRLGCVSYRKGGDVNSSCKTGLGSECSYDVECVEGKCYLGICSIVFPICGDGYCDGNERCFEDCNREAELLSFNKYSIPVDKDWVYVMDLTPEKAYSLSGEGTYKYNVSASSGVSGVSEYREKDPCPEINSKALVASVCGTCYPVSATGAIKPAKECPLLVRVNEQALIDNSGELILKISETNNSFANPILTKKSYNATMGYVDAIKSKDYSWLGNNTRGKVNRYYVLDSFVEGSSSFSSTIEIQAYEIEEDGTFIAELKNDTMRIKFEMYPEKAIITDIYMGNQSLTSLDISFMEKEYEEMNKVIPVKEENAVDKVLSTLEKEVPFPIEWTIGGIIILVLGLVAVRIFGKGESI